MPVSLLQKQRPTTHLYPATTCWAHWIGTARMLYLQHSKRNVNSQHDNHWPLPLTLHGGTHDDFWQQALQIVKHTIVPQQPVPLQSSKVLQTADFWPSPLTHKIRHKRQVDCPQMFHLVSTMPCPSNSTPSVPTPPTQGSATQTTVLFFHTASKTYCYLASWDIMQVLCVSALYHPHFCVNPTSMEYCSLQRHQQHFDTFLLQGQCPTHQACWLLVFWCSAPLPACPVPPHHVTTVQTNTDWWESPGLRRNFEHAPTQPISLIWALKGC